MEQYMRIYGILRNSLCKRNITTFYTKERTTLIKDSLRLSGFALIMLTAGIGLVAWWAYRELGAFCDL